MLEPPTASIAGTVTEAPVDDGDRVEADALLARVRGVGRRMAEQSLRQAIIETKQAAIEFKRQQTLAGTGAVSELSFERARRDRNQAGPIAAKAARFE